MQIEICEPDWTWTFETQLCRNHLCLWFSASIHSIPSPGMLQSQLRQGRHRHLSSARQIAAQPVQLVGANKCVAQQRQVPRARAVAAKAHGDGPWFHLRYAVSLCLGRFRETVEHDLSLARSNFHSFPISKLQYFNAWGGLCSNFASPLLEQKEERGETCGHPS